MAEQQPAEQQQPAGTEAEQGGEEQAEQSGEEKHQERLGRQYAKLRREKKEWDRERAAWEKEREAGRGELQRLSELRQKAPENIGAWLRAANISQEQLNQFLTRNTQRANDPYEQRISEETSKVREELAAYKAELQEMKNAQERGRNIDKISALVHAKPDDFELIRHYDAQPDVAEYIDLHFAEHGERIAESEACAIIERFLEDRDEEVVRRALAARKTAKRIGWQQPGEDAESQPGDDEGEPSPEKPPAQQRKQPTRGKPKLTNASPSSAKRRSDEDPKNDPYGNTWERFVASKTKRR